MTAQLPPDDATLRRFLLGDLPPADLEAVGRYLDAHPHAATTLAELTADDTLLSALRAPADATDPPEVAAAAARAAGLVVGEATTDATEPDDADDPLAALAPAEAPGELGRLGGYRVLRLLGRGGMGAVFEAADDRLNRRVALKVMLPALAAKTSARQRFLREAKAAAAVEHDHIVPIYQTGEDRGVPFLAMPLLAGETLDDRLSRGPLPAADVLRVGREVAEGLAAAHAAGLVHRDIKPSNIWLSEMRNAECGMRNTEPQAAVRQSAIRNPQSAFDRVRILDFGLARSAAGADGLTQSGAVLGTPAYMAPEQARGDAVDARADLFSLGVVLYHAATGRRPFAGHDTFSILTALATTEPPPAASVNPAVPAGLSALVARLLAKHPAGRPPSARAVADELARLAADAPRESVTQVIGVGADRADIGGDTTEAFDAAPRRRGSRRGWKVAAAVLFVAVVGLAAANGPTIVRVATNQGELVVEVDDPNTEVVVKGGAVELRREEGGKKRVYLVTATKAGEVEVREPGSDAVLVMEKFQLRRGGDVLVKVTAERLAAARGPAAGGATGSDGDRAAAQFVLALGGKVRVVYGPHERMIDAAGGLPPDAFRLVEAHLYSTPVTDADLPRLRAARSLTTLGLQATGVTDHGLERLKDFTGLENLNLHATKITDAGLAHVAGLTRLWHLAIHDNHDRITDAGMKHLTRLPALRHLDVRGTAVGDAGLEQINQLPVLESLVLLGAKVTDNGLPGLQVMKSLQHLNLDRTAVTDAGLVHLRRVSSLRKLELRTTKVTEAGVKQLAAALPACRIEWDGATIEPTASPAADPDRRFAEWVRSLGGNWSLTVDTPGQRHTCGPNTPFPAEPYKVTSLYLVSEPKQREIQPQDIELFQGVTGLTRVYLDNPGINDQTLPRLLAVLPASLERLQISTYYGRARVSDAAFAGVTRFPQLRWFGVDAVPLTDAACDYLRPHRGLELLDLVTTEITDDGMSRFPGLASVTQLGLPKNTGDDSARRFLTAGKVERLTLGKRCTPAVLPSVGKNTGLVQLGGVPRATTDADLLHLKPLSALGQLDLEDTQVTGATLAEFHGRPAITAVMLRGSKVADAELRHLKGFPGLRAVGLNGTAVTDAGLAHVAAVDTLDMLNLSDTAVTDAGLVPLVRAKGLRTLLLHRAKVTEPGVKRLAAARPDVRIAWDGGTIEPKASPFPHVRLAEWVFAQGGSVQLAGPGGEADRSQLPPGPREQVRIVGIKLNLPAGKGATAAGFAAAAKGVEFNAVWAGGGWLTDDHLAAIAQDDRPLGFLLVADTAVTEKGLSHLPGLPLLHHVGIYRTPVTAAGLAHVGRCRQLTVLALSKTGVTDAGLAGLAKLDLQQLDLIGDAGLTGDGLRHLAGMKQLSQLSLIESGVGDAGLAHLAGLAALRRVDVRQTKVTAAGVAKLAAALPACTVEWDGGTIEPRPAPALPAAAEPPAADAFPGRLVFYNRFQDAKAAGVFQGTRDGTRAAVEGGEYRLAAAAGKTGVPLVATFGPAAPDVAFFARTKVDAGTTQFAFRVRTNAAGGNWLVARVTAAGRWSVQRVDMTVAEGKRADKLMLLAEGTADDPALAAGRWITVAGRAVGPGYEVWVNGKLVARGTDAPAFDGPSTFTAAFQASVFGAADGPLGLTVDHAAAWDPTPPRAP